MLISQKSDQYGGRKGLRFLLRIRQNQLGGFMDIMKENGPYAWLSLGRKSVLMLNDAKGIEHVFKNNAQNYKKSKFYKTLRPLLGRGILLSEGLEWKKQRREVTPVFSPKSLEAMVPIMVDATQAMFRRLEPRIDRQEPIDLNFETMVLTLDIIFRTLFHESRNDIALGMQQSIIAMLREAETRVWSLLPLPQFITFRLPQYRKSLKFLNGVIEELFEARVQNKLYPEDLLSRLIANYGASAKERSLLRDQIMTFLLAGHETTANGLVWSFYYISQHPEILKYLQIQVNQVLGDDLPTMDTLTSLTYCRQVFDEVLRIHPIVWTMSRDNLTADKIPLESGTEISIPANTTVMLCTYAVHHRECYWENPENFDPSRFAPEKINLRPTFSYFPFGGGPRQCLGMRFALIESVMVLAMLVQNYELTLVPGQNIEALPNITLRPNGPVYFLLRKRQRGGVFEMTKAHADTTKAIDTAIMNKCPFLHSA